jgi:hypothetical protein
VERSQLCHALTACRFSQPQVRHEDGVGVNKDPLQQLSNVKMCVVCQAQGTVKRQYGFRVMDEQCENCNGEGCIITRPPSTADKIAKVEALIASATDLESLQRYEDALLTGKLDECLTAARAAAARAEAEAEAEADAEADAEAGKPFYRKVNHKW